MAKKKKRTNRPLSERYNLSKRDASVAHAHEVMQEFAHDFRRTRLGMGATYRYVAEGMGVASDNHVIRIERGANVTLETAIRAVWGLDAELVLTIRPRSR